MYVWEMIAHRLRGEGWQVEHSEQAGHEGPDYTVQLRRPGGLSVRATGPTLTDAFGAAARRAREQRPPLPIRLDAGPHFSVRTPAGHV